MKLSKTALTWSTLELHSAGTSAYFFKIPKGQYQTYSPLPKKR